MNVPRPRSCIPLACVAPRLTTLLLSNTAGYNWIQASADGLDLHKRAHKPPTIWPAPAHAHGGVLAAYLVQSLALEIERALDE